MILNYFILNLRNIKKQKGYSFINIAGLTLGMASCILILMFVQDELSFDTHHERADDIYRLAMNATIGGELSHMAIPPFAAGPAFAEEIPQIETYVRLFGRSGQVSMGDQQFEEEGIFFSDSTFFDVFTHVFMRGTAEGVLNEPGSTVITSETARRLFGAKDPMGEEINFAGMDLHITGVIEDVPDNSHFTFNYIISFTSLPEDQRGFLNAWLSINGWTYLLLKENPDLDLMTDQFAEIFEAQTGERARGAGMFLEFFLQKLTDIHLHSKLQYELGTNGDIAYVSTFSIVALFILLIACINFMNLSTARATTRGKEVGIRKAVGASRQNLMLRFMGESLFLALIGFVLSLGVVWMALGPFNQLSGKEMSMVDLSRGLILSGMLGIVILTGLVAGSYPAFVISAFNPVSVLRGQMIGGTSGSAIRKSLVVLQFSVSIALIIGTIVVFNQISFMKNKDLGFDKEHLLVMRMTTANEANSFNAFRDDLLTNANILSGAFSTGVPGAVGELRLFIPEGADSSETHVMNLIRVDFDFLQTLGMHLAEGRDFSLDFPSDSTEAWIINETGAARIGFAGDAVEKELELARVRSGRIVGVVEDFHFRSLTEKISPIALMISQQPGRLLSLRINSENISETLAFIEQKWNTFEPARPMDHFFVDEQFAEQYASEEKLADIISIFGILGIFIATLGLFGLASFTVQHRTKEIGIRKVLGASISSVWALIIGDFGVLVLISNIIAWPTAYYVMNDLWLTEFPYRISPALETFIMAGLLSIVITVLSVTYQALSAARANPVRALRSE